MHVYAHVYVWMHVRMLSCGRGGLRLTSGVFLWLLSAFVFWDSLSLNWSLITLGRPVGQWPSGIHNLSPLPWSLKLGLQEHLACSILICGFWEPKSGFHVCTACLTHWVSSTACLFSMSLRLFSAHRLKTVSNHILTPLPSNIIQKLKSKCFTHTFTSSIVVYFCSSRVFPPLLYYSFPLLLKS